MGKFCMVENYKFGDPGPCRSHCPARSKQQVCQQCITVVVHSGRPVYTCDDHYQFNFSVIQYLPHVIVLTCMHSNKSYCSVIITINYTSFWLAKDLHSKFSCHIKTAMQSLTPAS